MVEIRLFIRPERGICDHRNIDRTGFFHVYLSAGELFAARCHELPQHLAGTGGFYVCGEVRTVKAVVQGAVYEYVANMNRFAEKEIDLAEDTGHTPHILVLKIAAVRPFEYKNLQAVLAFVYEPCDVDFGREMADLAVGGKFVVHEHIERRIHTLEIEVDLPSGGGSR